MVDSSKSRWEGRILVGFFCAALLAHCYFVTRNWTCTFMSGHEFRQSQTAINSYYIDQQNNFSLLYETPIVGKPWVSILLEVPIYEWSVVLLSRATGLSHLLAARTISLACFYLTLPALYLLLGRYRLTRPRRLLILVLILTCPVYIYYTRAFLMDGMEIMCCAWFLLGFVRTMDERRWSWLALTIVAGTAAALIKNVTFAIWMLPAAAYGFWQLGRDLRAGGGWRPPVRTVLWGAATVVVALGALAWWIGLTDPIKAAHHSAYLFTAKSVSQGNWGLLNGGGFSPHTWGILFDRWREALMAPWVVGVFLLAGLLSFPAARWRILAPALVFLLAQLMFPFAYAYQDYYYYTCAIFLLAALGFILLEVLDARLPVAVRVLVVLIPVGAQLWTYWHGYRPDQLFVGEGDRPFTKAINDLTPKKSVIIVVGADWAAIIPYYAERKALMIRNGLEYDWAYLQRACDDLAGEDVSALVLFDKLKGNQQIVNFFADRFDFDRRVPTFTHPAAEVYLSRIYIPGAQLRLRVSQQYHDVTIPPLPAGAKEAVAPFLIPASVARTAFNLAAPAPYKGYFQFGVDHPSEGGGNLLSAHPDSDLWFHAPAGARRIVWEFGLLPAAYERDGAKTHGVVFLVTGEMPDGQQRQIFRRVLNPVPQPADRGRQHEEIAFEPRPGESLHFSTRPFDGYAFDWAYWAKIEIK